MSLDPIDVAAALRGYGPLALLDGASDDDGLGRWSHLGVDPTGAVIAWGRRVLVIHGGRRRWRRGDPLRILADRVGALPEAESGSDDPRPLRAGAIGYLGYEIGRLIEDLPVPRDDRAVLPDLAFLLFDDIAGYDRESGRWFGGGARLSEAIASPPRPRPPAIPRPTVVTPDVDRAAYVAAVARVREHIFAGDVYQVNLSQRFRAAIAESAFDLYRRVRARRPAPLGAYLECGRHAVLSNSPELFLRVRGREVETRPIKGTRARGVDAKEDAARSRELLLSAKDDAELTMIVDLLRNDLGKVALPGSVEVVERKRLVTLPTLHHLASTVTATLADGVGPAELLGATFPGGSITGCPKIRAMEIVSALEPCRRGVYTGAIGWIAPSGELTLNVAIRTAVVRGRELSFHAGGGIVADSEPEAEYDETLVKARAFLEALT